MTYQPGVPTGPIPLNQDYLNINGNFTALNNTFSQDHSPLTGVLPPTGTAGYHTAVHLVPQATPVATAGYGQLYSANRNDGFSTDQQLFWITGGGKNLTLTSNIVPVRSPNGYTFLPGGLVLQWGTIVAATKNALTPASFNINFPAACLSMQGTLSTGTTGSVITLTPNGGAPPISGFSYFINTNSSQTFNFYWWAIGY